jgi:putative hemolysin
MFKVLLVGNGRLLEQAQALRNKVFFGRRGRDADSFDKFCRHLVVVEKKSGRVVGTYRLLGGSIARKQSGFYSEGEFDLGKIKKNCRGNLLEMGRACVDSAYRARPVINLLWGRLLDYYRQNKVRYVFGCASIPEPSRQKIGAVYRFFKKRHFAPEKFRVRPLKEKRYPYDKNGKLKEGEVLKLIPSLVKGYLRMGAYVCSEPVWDKEFNTADFFMLLDTKKINASYRKKFK